MLWANPVIGGGIVGGEGGGGMHGSEGGWVESLYARSTQKSAHEGRVACLPSAAVVRAPLAFGGGVYLLCMVCVSIVLFVSWSFFFHMFFSLRRRARSVTIW